MSAHWKRFPPIAEKARGAAYNRLGIIIITTEQLAAAQKAAIDTGKQFTAADLTP